MQNLTKRKQKKHSLLNLASGLGPSEYLGIKVPLSLETHTIRGVLRHEYYTNFEKRKMREASASTSPKIIAMSSATMRTK